MAVRLLGLAAVVAMSFAAVWHLHRAQPPDAPPRVAAGSPSTAPGVARGEYLVRAGNCVSCHTARGEPSFAGGRAIPTPFGTLYSTNLTPDVPTGLGNWSAEDFWRALHEG
ncbi:MAG: cytochrome c, partial [Betaproteobacteria bacterium]